MAHDKGSIEVREPREIPKFSREDAKEDALFTTGGVGCGTAFGIWMTGGAVSAVLSGVDLDKIAPTLLTISIGFGLMGALIAYPLALRKHAAKKEKEKYEAKKDRAKEAEGNVARWRNEAEGRSRDLSRRLSDATRAISAAEEYFEERAYAPFWDSVEEAAIQLARFNSDVREIASVQVREARELNAWEGYHTFGEFPVRRASIPNPKGVIRQLNETVRKGQRDFEFATIWEQRSTRKVLVEGFRTLGQTVVNLERTIAISLEELK